MKTITLGFILLALFMILVYYVGFGQDITAAGGAADSLALTLSGRNGDIKSTSYGQLASYSNPSKSPTVPASTPIINV